MLDSKARFFPTPNKLEACTTGANVAAVSRHAVECCIQAEEQAKNANTRRDAARDDWEGAWQKSMDASDEVKEAKAYLKGVERK